MLEPMSSVEPARHALYSVLENVLGEQHADTLMTHLPQHDSDEVATKSDLNGFGERVDTSFQRVDERFERVDERFDRMEARFDRMEDRFDALNLRFDSLHQTLQTQFRNYTVTMVGAMTALTAIYTFLN